MKKVLSIVILLGILFGALTPASAAITNIFVEDWGTTNGGSAVLENGNINRVGWTGVAVSQTAGPYLGIYVAGGASDPASGEALPPNTVYFTILRPNQTAPGMFYTTAGADFPDGTDAAFANINPGQYTNLTLSVEVRGAATDTNYFAVRINGTWFVSTYRLPDSGGAVGLPYPQFTNATLLYTNAASAWRNLTIGATSVTIGSSPVGNLSGAMTGIGIVQLPTANGFNYNRLAISATIPGAGPPPTPPTITAGPINQTEYAGGGAQFLASASGTPPLTYVWQTNGVTLTEGGKYSGTTNNVLTIKNVDDNDAAATYSVFVTNAGGTSLTNSGFTLTVVPTPPDYLYAERFPYVGPNGNLPVTGVGWLAAFQGATGIYSSGPGIGNVFSYSSIATTNIYYATTNSETGASGLRFVEINPAGHPFVTFQANFTPGNGDSLDATFPTNVVAYWAVQMANGNWYVSANRIPVQTISPNSYQPYEMAFNPAAANWNTLTIGANTAAIGGQAPGPLTGNIIGAGVVITHLGLGGGGDFNFNSFVLTTNAVSVLPPTIGVNGVPWDQTVAAGGGASFGVSAGGSAPFSYGWTLKGAPLVNGGRISGATSPTLTIANLTASDTGPVVVSVTNSVGFDKSDNYFAVTLTVNNPPVGLLYSETFPFVGPLAGNFPISSAGWVEAVAGAPNALFQVFAGDGAVFAFRGVPDTTVYYATTTSDTNQAGLPFPNINLASYADLNISVDIAPTFNAANVTAYLAVQINGTSWYVAANALPVPTSDSGTYSTYSTAFNPAAANWKNLIVTSAGGVIGSPAAGDLKGVMTGVGFVFVTVGAGGTHNFDNITITGSGLGGINVGPLTGGSVNLSWVGNPVVGLESTTGLNPPNWQAVVPSTLGLYSLMVTNTGPQKFFRLTAP